MERFFWRLNEAINCPSPIVPAKYAHLQAATLIARRMHAVCSDTKSGVLTDTNGAQFVVKLPATVHDVEHCDCKQYPLMLRPCRHPVAPLHKLKLSVVPYFHAYYTTEVWNKIYKRSFPPISITDLEVSELQPPTFQGKRGLPQKERKEVDDASKPKTCFYCGREDHRRKDCQLAWDLQV
ncbi:hypothetical protein CF327_g5278 [Tilletia walkeri]|nr:hypothetical protein CF327_g5278 [Tilletia walkeri]